MSWVGGAHLNTVLCEWSGSRFRLLTWTGAHQTHSSIAAVLVATIRGQGCISHNDRQDLGDSALPPTQSQGNRIALELNIASHSSTPARLRSCPDGSVASPAAAGLCSV